MIGYSSNSKAYRCYERKTGRIHITRNVEFIESQDETPRRLTAAQTGKKIQVPSTKASAPVVPEPAENTSRPVRTRKVRGEDGAFPDIRKEAAVAEARAAEARAKERRTDAKTQRATVEQADEVEAEEEPKAPADDDEYEYWALSPRNGARLIKQNLTLSKSTAYTSLFPASLYH
ncbi:hypothetical protein FB451DRAFT_1207222 [Mycena latifolia]|nr:hypothetical protein FB451DRAFT_1207222 [Mycena latifolia]